MTRVHRGIDEMAPNLTLGHCRLIQEIEADF
jgi:hypothetical protein